MRLFDSHAHLTDDGFASDLDETLARAAEAGVEAVVSIASDLEDARAALALADRARRPRVFATAGIHPHAAGSFEDTAFGELEALADDARVVALGETGLDFFYDNAPRDAQRVAFRSQLELAERLGLPVVVHAREADAEVAALVGQFAGRVVGVLHCFSSGAALLQAGLDAGWYVSFSGLITFKKYDDVELVRRVPDDRLLVETDSPYLAPVPKRGRRNEPALVRHTVEKLAEMRGQTLEDVADLTYRNACRFYGQLNIEHGARSTEHGTLK
ncbi:MAG: TatD family hydrolase [Gemmatimonadetes bacterium]|uniref:TatD family hydrolase n=1 Tax=Candidatus Kutchimonas denitrificans TaxID=3056748 RepID=A0AAE4Z9Z1_9BACT|nr:TatD family hydrolase [Gemmatimonadota bacterium]NIR76024.1 TatD family hydrolase [Candidatus Kutchimonas denitrificans]NIS02216.1 TatD family hydrolase [Gemmatimonadota bacterium]NIT68042.1 TatD family hydrolase [Gemmatimonadota bacterium]NIU54068.1 YchF/TatD family DNA exonuclease [Gemmatimonadota bacterium]